MHYVWMQALTKLLDGSELVFDLRDLHLAAKWKDLPGKQLSLARNAYGKGCRPGSTLFLIRSFIYSV
jgi:hypothetical protein